MSEKIAVKFLPSGKSVLVPRSCTILHAARMAGLWIDAPCNGSQICGKCRVRILEGEVHSNSATHRLPPDDIMNGWRLACAATVFEPVSVEIPHSSGSHVLSKILVDGEEVRLRHDLRQSGHLGVAVDVGTTSVAAVLFDLYRGEERESCATHNQQIQFGDDVISRIAVAREHSDGLQILQRSVVATLNHLIERLCVRCGEKPSSIYSVVAAGNTTMQQMLLGIDPSPLGEYPFEPAFKESRSVSAAALGLSVNSEAVLQVFPQIGGFVGGDTVAGVMAADFDTLTKPALFIDIGTNGEIALLKEGRIFAASTAAGPAFEGARIQHGMRAKEGAIDQIWQVGDQLHLHTIGESQPVGLCGSALIDGVALLLEDGLVDSTGQLGRHASARGVFAERIFDGPNGQPCFALTYNDAGVAEIFLTQRDVRELQLASGTIRAGIETLLLKTGVTVKTLDSIYLAGGFGNYIRREKALAIGMLPPVHYLSIHFIGNAALTGAKRGLLSRREMERADKILGITEHVDLSAQPQFSELFMQYISFPE